MDHRVRIEHSFEGTVAYFGKDDVVVRGIVKGAGFRWSRNVGGWYLNSTWGEATRRARVEQVVRQFEADEVEVEDGGRAPRTSAAEREQAAQERAAERAERMDEKAGKLTAQSEAKIGAARSLGSRIPFGQPVLVGHHSQRRHENDLAKIDAGYRAGFALADEAAAASAAADRAQATAEGVPALTRLRRIERKKVELRDIERRIAASSNSEYIERMTALRDQLVDEIAHDERMVEASGRKVYAKADVAKGDVVIVRGRPRKVVRVNAKSVSVETGYSWTDTVPYHEITRVVSVSEQTAAGQ